MPIVELASLFSKNKWTPRGVLRVPINDQVTLRSKRTALFVDKISAHL